MGHADRYPRITMRAMAVIMAFIITASAMEAPFQCTRTMSSSPFTAMDASLPESVVPKAAFSTADVNNGFVFKCDVGAPVVVRSGGVFTVPLSVESQCRSVGLMVRPLSRLQQYFVSFSVFYRSSLMKKAAK